MRRTRLTVGAAAAAATVTALLLGGIFRESSAADAGDAGAAGGACDGDGQLQSGFGAGGHGTAADRGEAPGRRCRRTPNDVNALDLLGLAYQQRARETGDPSYYTKSDRSCDRALRLAPHDLSRRAGSARSRSPATASARRSCSAAGRTRISPTTALNYGIIGDALVELGRYDEAFQAFDTMATLKPSLSSLRARLATPASCSAACRERDRGDEARARRLRGTGRAEAWTRFQLGKLHWSLGRVEPPSARTAPRSRVFPGYPYALDGLAADRGRAGPLPRRDRARAAGRRRDAAAAVRRAARRPLPRRRAEPAQAREQYALIGVIERLLVANGVKTDLETALFDVDHGIRLRAVARARPDGSRRAALDRRRRRPRVGARPQRPLRRGAPATRQRALRLGTRDALQLFHRGMIERCLGTGSARSDFCAARSRSTRTSRSSGPPSRERHSR